MTAPGPPSLDEAFARLQRGDAPGALAASEAILRAQPAHPRALLAAGIALRTLGRLAEARSALERAERAAPGDYAPAFELGGTLGAAGEHDAALAKYERAAALRPAFLAAHFAIGLERLRRGEAALAAGAFRAALALDPRHLPSRAQLAQALALGGRDEEAAAAFEQLLAATPASGARVAYGRYCVSRGRFERAAGLFAQALADGDRTDGLPMYLAQVLLLLGRRDEGWRAYAAREPRRAFEARCAAAGTRYALPALTEVGGRDLVLVAEQGLGDTLFFLRFAPALAGAGARLAFRGDTRLHPLLGRTGLFAALHAPDSQAQHVPGALLVGDLPAVRGMPAVAPSLRIPADPQRLARWRSRLEAAGPRPWIGLAWRAGTAPEAAAHALHKALPLEPFLAAAARLPGTLFALQRAPAEDELRRAASAAGRPVHDLAAANDDLEEALAAIALLDRVVGVSNTNVHLAAAAGTAADVLVPFPPEWRWGIAGDSPWFPGFRVLRQAPREGWEAPLAAIAAVAR